MLKAQMLFLRMLWGVGGVGFLFWFKTKTKEEL